MHHRKPVRLALVLSLLTAAFGAGRLMPGSSTADRAARELATAQDLSAAFRRVSERAGESVVSLRAEVDGSRSQGSGVIIRSDGIVVTNNHVVANRAGTQVADDILAFLSDGRRFRAEVVGIDSTRLGTDLAVLRLHVGDERLPAMDLAGDADVGEWVLALGNPFGLGHTVTAGILSGKGREGLGVAMYEDFLQTDAAINPGNSGGALIDLEGELVGINTAVGTDWAGTQGLSFAIPSYIVRHVVDQILDGGRVRRGFLGVQMWPERVRGREIVTISDVTPDSPADRADLREGDVIRTIDGEPVTSLRHARFSIAAVPPDTDVVIGIERAGRELAVPVRLGDRDDYFR